MSNKFIVKKKFHLDKNDFDILVYYKRLMKAMKKIEKDSKADVNLYFKDECDSNASYFEELSNLRALGVKAKDKKVALMLLRFLNMIYFNIEEMQNNKPITNYGLSWISCSLMDNFEDYDDVETDFNKCFIDKGYLKYEKFLKFNKKTYHNDYCVYNQKGKCLSNNKEKNLVFDEMICRKVFTIEEIDTYIRKLYFKK